MEDRVSSPVVHTDNLVVCMVASSLVSEHNNLTPPCKVWLDVKTTPHLAEVGQLKWDLTLSDSLVSAMANSSLVSVMANSSLDANPTAALVEACPPNLEDHKWHLVDNSPVWVANSMAWEEWAANSMAWEEWEACPCRAIMAPMDNNPVSVDNNPVSVDNSPVSVDNSPVSVDK
jgi:hypothetical protein